MENTNLYESFVGKLNEKIPRKSHLANTVAEILMIEKESVYRRLRGDVHFTLCEAGTIADKLDISLDSLLGQNIRQAKKLLPMSLPANSNVHKPDYELMESFIEVLKRFCEQPYCEHGIALNSLPSALHCYWQYPCLTRFFLFKWAHRYYHTDFYKTYDEIELPKQLTDIQRRTSHYYERITSTFYIFDPNAVAHLVNDIKYFDSIQLLSKANVSLLKKELELFLDELEILAVTGRYEATGNKFELYVANVNIGMTSNYIWSEDLCASMFTTFIVQAVGSYNQESCAKIKNWVQSLKRVSTLISETGKRERVIFFQKQREMVAGI